MNMKLLMNGCAGVVLLFMTLSALAQGKERGRLYTAPDMSASGGIAGRIIKPEMPIVQILAMPPDEPRFVYEGQIAGANRQAFTFANLPTAKYNLFVIYENEFYEGLQLTREPDTLTQKDRAGITKIVTDSDPFFPKKIIHRMEGSTGRGNFARCIVTMFRDDPGDVQWKGENLMDGEARRTFKLIWLKDVGVGWQVVQKRDLYPVTVELKKLKNTHNYSEKLSNIRVTDKVKNLGDIDLSNDKKNK